jgi:hypothetical protein
MFTPWDFTFWTARSAYISDNVVWWQWEAPIMGDKEAAAILVQTLFESNDSLRRLIDEKASVSTSPEEAAKFLIPYYEAMLLAVSRINAKDVRV